MRTIILIAALAASPVFGQGSAKGVVPRANSRSQALEAIKAGDAVSAVARLRAGVKRGPRAADEDVQIVADVCFMARELQGAGHAAGRVAGELAITEATKAKGKTSRRDQAYLDARIGELYETVIGDADKAKEKYRSALSQDSTRKDAAAGLDRLGYLQSTLRQKQAENEFLRNGGK